MMAGRVMTLALVILALGGCGDSYDDADYVYYGDLHDCRFDGLPCTASPWCVTKEVHDINNAHIECHDGYEYRYLYFRGIINHCYFNGRQCLIIPRECDQVGSAIECYADGWW
jgi:hypothetical protein